jgi:hypothetical protein
MQNEQVTTIQLNKSVVRALKSVKKYKRQTYNEVILDLVGAIKKERKNSQYDEFLYEIQKTKMTELWDNAEDEAWENV